MNRLGWTYGSPLISPPRMFSGSLRHPTASTITLYGVLCVFDTSGGIGKGDLFHFLGHGSGYTER